MRLGLETSPHFFAGGCLKTSLDVLLHCICKEALAHAAREAVPGSVCRDGHVLVEVQPHFGQGTVGHAEIRAGAVTTEASFGIKDS